MDKETIIAVYQEAESQKDRDETVKELAKEFDTYEFEIRQILQDAKVYVEKDGRTEKESYAYALQCVTGVTEREYMKMSLPALKKLMGVFRGE